MAEFLNQDEIDTLLDIAGQDIKSFEHYVRNISELKNLFKNMHSADMILTRVEKTMLLSRAAYLIELELGNLGSEINDALRFHKRHGIVVEQLIEHLERNEDFSTGAK